MAAQAKHEYIGQRVRELYIDNKPAREALPTERKLAEEFGVTRATVRHALGRLETDGLVSRIQGSGTFTMGPTIAKSLKLTSFSEDIRLRGMIPSSTLLRSVEIPADVNIARNLQISPGEPIVQLVRLQLANAEPMCIEVASLRAHDVPGLLDLDLTGSLYDLLGERYSLIPFRAEQVVTATVTTQDESTVLRVPPFSPALRVTRTALDSRSRPLEFTTTLYRSDRYEIRFTVRRDS